MIKRFTAIVTSTKSFERETLRISDDRKAIVDIETKTVENGLPVTASGVELRFQHDNHLGCASLELDSTAAIISYEEYHPFGTTSYRSGRTETEVSLKRYKYIGKERDEETGLYYYGARYYAGWIARFVSVDPLQHKYPHYTPYQYAGNKPVSYIDLDGLEEAKRETPGISPLESKETSGIEHEDGQMINISLRDDSYIDYYNTSGKWIGIGWGNSERGDKYTVLSNSVESKIRKQTRHNDFVSLTKDESFSVVPVYSQDEINAMDKVFTDSEESSCEEGFAAGLLNNNVITARAVRGANAKLSIGTAYQNLGRLSVNQKDMLYDAHSHPAQIKFNSTRNSFSLAGFNPSNIGPDADLIQPDILQPKIVLGYNIQGNQELITDSERNNAKSHPNDWVPLDASKFPKMISFYRKNNHLKSSSYAGFKEAMKKIRNHNPLTESKRRKILWPK